MIPKGFKRVTRTSPCRVCGKSDWCLVAKDNTKALCPRVVSSQPAGEAGYLHSLDGNTATYQYEVPQKPVTIDAEAMSRNYVEALGRDELNELSLSLGVSPESLLALGVGRAIEWCEGTFSFPMRNADGTIIGIRLRNIEGHKWAVYGSKNGLFYDSNQDHSERVFVCEGPTSAAALHDFEFQPIGRPSNNSGTDILKTMLSRSRPAVVIMSEMDGKSTCSHCENNYCLACHPGQVGADKCAAAINGVAKCIKIIEPLKGKDVRAWKQHGATRQSVLTVVDNSPLWAGSFK